jgi:hypothetical protein
MHSGRATKFLLLLAAIGMIARLILAAVSIGSYDAIHWRQFAEQISANGIVETYRANPHFNHPPIPGWWASIGLAISNATSLRFAFVFKLPMLASDAIVCVLLWKITRKRGSATFAAAIVAAYAWNLDALLLSAYHCNTDSIYAMLALLAVYLVEERRAHVLGGLALGAAINVKLIPIVLLIPMLGAYRDWRFAARFLAGIAFTAVPFLIPLMGARDAFVHHALAYTSAPSYWGINVFLRELVRIPRFSGWSQPIMDGFHELGRYVVLLAIALFTLVIHRRCRPNVDRYQSCAVTAAIFLILAPGFGMQYTVFPIPLLMVASPFYGTLYGTIAGIGSLFVYWLAWTGAMPLESTLGSPEGVGPPIGLVAWAVLIAFVWGVLRGRDESR